MADPWRAVRVTGRRIHCTDVPAIRQQCPNRALGGAAACRNNFSNLTSRSRRRRAPPCPLLNSPDDRPH